MTVGDALFARLAIRGFASTGAQIGGLQARIASGANDPRASADPAGAIQLSALRDIRARLGTETGVGRAAADRLALADQTLAGLSDNLRQLKEISLRAANDTLTPEAHAGLRVAAETLRGVMLAAANAPDMSGRPLFSGTAPGPAFALAGGEITYRGNDAAPVARLGANTSIATGLPGSRVFGDGADGLFRLLDDTIAALSEPMLSARSELKANGQARLELQRSREERVIEVALAGPAGMARVRLDLRLDAPNAPVEAINALSATTGISAVLEPNGKDIRLMATGSIAVSDQTGDSMAQPSLSLVGLDDTGKPAGPVTRLRPAGLTADALVGRASMAVEHVATMRAATGSLAEAVDRRIDAIAANRLTVDQAAARLEDLDVAETLTKLQSLLLTEQASQQTFVKIVGQSLFNYLR